ncbi:MAG: hypothetical protein JWR35_3662 [Marmoricola sp.]|nr:hypothetical protein [Marmoricola sp.]
MSGKRKVSRAVGTRGHKRGKTSEPKNLIEVDGSINVDSTFKPFEPDDMKAWLPPILVELMQNSHVRCLVRCGYGSVVLTKADCGRMAGKV